MCHLTQEGDPSSGPSLVRSELFLSGGAAVEDNGTFACEAENQVF